MPICSFHFQIFELVVKVVIKIISLNTKETKNKRVYSLFEGLFLIYMTPWFLLHFSKTSDKTHACQSFWKLKIPECEAENEFYMENFSIL